MKRTKNVARLLTVILVLCMIFLPLVACKKTQNVNGYCTVVVATDPETVYTVDLDKLGTVEDGLLTVLNYLKENNGLTYEESGGFLTKVLSLEQGENYDPFISLYTSVEKDFAVGYGDEKTYNGTKIFTSGEGAKTMTIQADAVYYITLAANLF